jgi:hypothetical protein
MIRQHFYVENYWEVVVYWNVDYHFFSLILDDIQYMEVTEKESTEMRKMMESGKAKAVTISNTRIHKSTILFNKHETMGDYLNSVVHEAEHVKQAMLRAYNVEDKGEPPAYTIGYLVGRMWKVFQLLL